MTMRVRGKAVGCVSRYRPVVGGAEETVRSPGMAAGSSVTSVPNSVRSVIGDEVRWWAHPPMARDTRTSSDENVLGVKDTVDILFHAVFFEIGGSTASDVVFLGSYGRTVHRIAQRLVLAHADCGG